MASKIPRVPMREQDPIKRASNFEEVSYGYNDEEALLEAGRCLNCKKPLCVPSCPVNLQIPQFISKIVQGDIEGAAEVIARDSSLPAVCGRVCPQETQCEGTCVLRSAKREAVAIGRLERYVADYMREKRSSSSLTSATSSSEGSVGASPSSSLEDSSPSSSPTEATSPSSLPSSEALEGSSLSSTPTPSSFPSPTSSSPSPSPSSSLEDSSPSLAEASERKKVAVVGSGPAGLACAADLAKFGYDVTIFEALHKPGGVLAYGIPEFRLPKEKVLAAEIEEVCRLGVKIETNVIIGRTLTVDELMDKQGFSAVFISTGAGTPKFMGIPGENLCGVFSANEFLTRTNLMNAYREDYMTPLHVGKVTCVVGGGNVAMDAARTALRLGSKVHIIYRRTEAELPSRLEEVHHAMQEGIVFDMLTNPVEVLGDEKGWVRALKCIRMELGELDESGRRSPVPVPDSEFEIEADTVIMALGTSPNPLIPMTTKALETDKRGRIVADEFGATSRPGVFAGGDAVTGAATVILAMGAGRKAAKAMDEYLKNIE